MRTVTHAPCQSIAPFRRSKRAPRAARPSATAASRRQLGSLLTALVACTAPAEAANAAAMEGPFTSEPVQDPSSRQGAFKMSEKEWKEKLTQPQYSILRQGSTERPFVSPLLNEKRTGLQQLPHLQYCMHNVEAISVCNLDVLFLRLLHHNTVSMPPAGRRRTWLRKH